MENLTARLHEKSYGQVLQNPLRDFQAAKGFSYELNVLARLGIELAPSTLWVHNTVNWATQDTYFAVIKCAMHSCLLCYE